MGRGREHYIYCAVIGHLATIPAFLFGGGENSPPAKPVSEKQAYVGKDFSLVPISEKLAYVGQQVVDVNFKPLVTWG